MNKSPDNPTVVERAKASAGTSSQAILRAIRTAVDRHEIRGGTVIDVGAGRGDLWHHLRGVFDRYVGVDVVKYDEFPDSLEFISSNLDGGSVNVSSHSADLVACVETIEHVENPRHLIRELVRLAKVGGWVIVSTPNQISALSKLTLVMKDQFNAFQSGQYPAHITALLPIDLLRMAREAGLCQISIAYSQSGRIPGTAAYYPDWLSRLRPQTFSDNVILAARVPQAL